MIDSNARTAYPQMSTRVSLERHVLVHRGSEKMTTIKISIGVTLALSCLLLASCAATGETAKAPGDMQQITALYEKATAPPQEDNPACVGTE